MIEWLQSLSQDSRYALRALRATPGFVLVTLASLALGIGANTAIFSLMNALMLKSLPVERPEGLVVLENGSWTNPIWEHIRDHQNIFDGVFAWGTTRLNLSDGGEANLVRGIFASGSYFEVLGVRPILGRTFKTGDDRRGCGAEGAPVVVSYGFWQSHYGGDPQALGRQLSLEGQPFTVIGVTPARFFGTNVGEGFDVAVPICAEARIRGADSGLDERTYWWLEIAGRLRDAQTRSEAEAGLRSMQPSLREATMPDWAPEHKAQYLEDPFTLARAGSGVSSLRDRYGDSLLVLMGVSALVLLVACANIANLFLARAVARRKDLAIRISVGASRLRIIQQLLVESLLIGFSGAAAGIVLAQATSRILVHQLSTGARPAFLDTAPDAQVLGFAAAVGLVTGLVFGLFPALVAGGRAPVEAIRETTRAPGAAAGAGRWLVTVQVALSLALLFAAALFLRSYASLVSLDPGFDRTNVLVVQADVRGVSREEDADGIGKRRRYEQILDELSTVPGVSSAAASLITPLSGAAANYGIQVDGYPPSSDQDRLVYYNYVSPGYFRTLGSALLAGRDLEATDRENAPRVAVVNETMARKFFGGDALGRTYRARQSGKEWEVITIVGIVRDAKYRRLTEPIPPTAYAPLAQVPPFGFGQSYVVRARGELEGLRERIVERVEEMSPAVTLSFRTLQSQIDDSLVQERLLALLSAIFGLLALTVAAVGLAGLVSYSVSRRRPELGIRSALGATPRGLVRLVLRDVLLVTSLGLLLGAAVSLASGRFVSSLLYDLSPSDPTTLFEASGLLAGVAVVAGLVPASRAARIDAMECLRAE
jgi:putative ABC transport system permease protein